MEMKTFHSIRRIDFRINQITRGIVSTKMNLQLEIMLILSGFI